MASTSRTSISALPRGHEFPAIPFAISPAQVAAYVGSIGDATPYRDIVPPLALVALGLAALQEQLSLPEGALHTGQEVEHRAVAHAGDALVLTGRIAQRSERQGFVISVVEFEVASGGVSAVSARTTIMVPAL